MSSPLVAESKFLSLLLRHKPEAVGLQLDGEGWAVIDDIVRLTAKGHSPLSRSAIEQIVATSDKKRFVISADGVHIRANQGHSIPVDLGLPARTPPPMLFHGTARRFLPSILQQGLLRGSRQHVHLSQDTATALKVGQRHGSPVILSVAAGAMHEDGHAFFLSENGVWLTEHVPSRYLSHSENAHA